METSVKHLSDCCLFCYYNFLHVRKTVIFAVSGVIFMYRVFYNVACASYHHHFLNLRYDKPRTVFFIDNTLRLINSETVLKMCKVQKKILQN